MVNKAPAGGRVLWTVLHLILGFVAWFVLTMLLVVVLEKVMGPIGESNLAGGMVVLFLLSGIIVVPLGIFLRWYVATSVAVALDTETGMTLTRKSMRRGVQIKQHRWQDVTGTEMTCITTNNGAVTKCTFHMYTSDGETLEIPLSMGSFNYFLDIVNRASTHLPYTWKYLDHETARSQGTERGWNRVTRQQK